MKPLVFTEGNPKEFELATRAAMQAPLQHFEKELATLRTGRASTALVADLRIDCYGQLMPLRDIATLSTPDARLIVIQPWDRSNIELIEQAINQSELGLTPANDGAVIRLQLPMMSTERRAELVKQLGKKTEECRVGIRNVRKEFHNQVREAAKDASLSEDFAKRLTDLLQKITDEHIAKAETLASKKEAELKA